MICQSSRLFAIAYYYVVPTYCHFVIFFCDTTREACAQTRFNAKTSGYVLGLQNTSSRCTTEYNIFFHDSTLRHFNKCEHKVVCVHHVVVHSLLSIEQALDPLFGGGYLWDCWVCNCLSLATSHVHANQGSWYFSRRVGPSAFRAVLSAPH